jgi:hypothetical protein
VANNTQATQVGFRARDVEQAKALKAIAAHLNINRNKAVQEAVDLLIEKYKQQVALQATLNEGDPA